MTSGSASHAAQGDPASDSTPSLETAGAAQLRPGSEWYELVIRASLAHPERWSGPPHGSPKRWDWGVTLRSLCEAQQRHARLERFAAGMSPAERDALWSDPSPEAAQLRSVMR